MEKQTETQSKLKNDSTNKTNVLDFIDHDLLLKLFDSMLEEQNLNLLPKEPASVQPLNPVNE